MLFPPPSSNSPIRVLYLHPYIYIYIPFVSLTIQSQGFCRFQFVRPKLSPPEGSTSNCVIDISFRLGELNHNSRLQKPAYLFVHLIQKSNCLLKVKMLNFLESRA